MNFIIIEHVKLLKDFVPEKNLMASSTNIYRFNLLDLLYIRHGKIGVVLDGDCRNPKKLISWASHV